MMPHIYASLQGYPGRWVHSLEDEGNITVCELLAHMDHAFSDVHDYDTLIRSLYEIRQKESKSVEEYMLQIHEAMAVIHHMYPDQISEQGRNLMTGSTMDCHPACMMHLGLLWPNCLRGNR